MSAFETYKQYLGLVRHFTSDSYDWFLYRGNVKCTPEAFERRNDKYSFLKISRVRDPLNFMIGNMIFGASTWPGNFTPDHAMEYEKFLSNGIYPFKQDLVHLKDNFNDNFVVDESHSIPYIITLYRTGKVSLHTCCVFESLLSCDKKWRATPQYIIFSNISKKIAKSAGFFHIDSAKYRALILNRFNA